VGRSETPVDPNEGPVQSFACDLRALRAAAGNVPYRVLAKQAHYSIASLSQAAAGRSLPSLAVTLAFVRACGGDVAEWERRWRAVSAACQVDGEHDDAPPAPGTPGQLAPAPSGDVPDIVSAGPVDAPNRPRWATPRVLRTALIALAAVAACAVAVTGLTVGFAPRKGPVVVASVSQPNRPGKADPVADGSDPNRAGCGPGAVTMASAAVHFPATQLSGEIELRYSPRCHAAWGRFEPAVGWNPGPGTTVAVWTIRPADQATQSYSVEFGGEAIIGNMLLTVRGCVAAEVTMTRGSVRSPVATTACVVIPRGLPIT